LEALGNGQTHSGIPPASLDPVRRHEDLDLGDLEPLGGITVGKFQLEGGVIIEDTIFSPVLLGKQLLDWPGHIIKHEVQE
jgi:hypothetical protein